MIFYNLAIPVFGVDLYYENRMTCRIFWGCNTVHFHENEENLLYCPALFVKYDIWYFVVGLEVIIHIIENHPTHYRRTVPRH